MENDDELEKIGDSILDQLQSSLTTKPPQSTKTELAAENLEKFVLDNSATLVTQSMEAVENLKDYIQAGASDREILAFAEQANAPLTTKFTGLKVDTASAPLLAVATTECKITGATMTPVVEPVRPNWLEIASAPAPAIAKTE